MTTKLIAALYGEHPRPALHDPALRARLAAVGCTAVQVNADDADVAPAMRFGPGDAGGQPITAFVTAWTEDAGSALAVLTSLEDGAHVFNGPMLRRCNCLAIWR